MKGHKLEINQEKDLIIQIYNNLSASDQYFGPLKDTVELPENIQ